MTVGKTNFTVIGVREIWARGPIMTYNSADGWKMADPKLPAAYLYKVADGSYVYAATTGGDVHEPRVTEAFRPRRVLGF